MVLVLKMARGCAALRVGKVESRRHHVRSESNPEQYGEDTRMTMQGHAFLGGNIRSLGMWLALTCLVVPLPAAESVRVAVIPAGGKQVPPAGIVDLVTAEMSQQEGTVLLDRQDLSKVLQEQDLAILSTAASVSQRVKLGRLIGADVMVLISTHQMPTLHYQVVTSETQRGLRLRYSLIPSSGTPADLSRSIIQDVRQALQKRAEPLKGICAVLPFVSRDMAGTHSHLQTAYARMLEELLLRIPGVIVVEMAEAKALSDELSLTGKAVEREFPLYLMGEFRHETSNPAIPPFVRIAASRGSRTLASRDLPNAQPTNAVSFLRQATTEIIDTLITAPAPKGNLELECRSLGQRGQLMFSIGHYEEAAQLAEASLLLDSRQCDVQYLAMNAYGRCSFQKTRTPEDIVRYSELALVHLEPYLLMGQFEKMDSEVFCAVFNAITEAFWNAGGELQCRMRDMYARVIECRHKEGRLNNAFLSLVFDRYRNAQQSRFLDQLDTYNDPDLKAVVKAARRFLEPAPPAPVVVAKPVPLPPDSSVKINPPPVNYVHLTPINLKLVNSSPRDPPFNPEGLIPCGKSADVVLNWDPGGQREVYLMETPGLLKRVYQTDNQHAFVGPVYDGQGVWLPIRGQPSSVLYIRAPEGVVAEFSDRDGLPDFVSCAVAALGPRRLCLSGSFGSHLNQRAFVAVLEFSEKGEKKLRIIHEATGQPLPDKGAKEQHADPLMSFNPSFMVYEKSGADPVRKLAIVRSLPGALRGNPPLLLDPQAERVEVMKIEVAGHICTATIHEGAAYWIDNHQLFCLRTDSQSMDPIRKVPAYQGKIFFHGGKIHVLGFNERGNRWWMADALQAPFQEVSDQFPRVFGMANSAHYGLTLCGGERPRSIYTVTIDPLPDPGRSAGDKSADASR